MEAKFLLSRRANEACKLMHDDMYKKDLWMWDQDWSTKSINLKRPVKTKLRKLQNFECNNEKDQQNENR